ncbi:hypothetical protein, partial [Photobacterium galatheae]|uniref:hypothetical protein n=1 Tax=Photobacterium galatheae TaxID=1654360 RepID=UPI001F1AD044
MKAINRIHFVPHFPCSLSLKSLDPRLRGDDRRKRDDRTFAKSHDLSDVIKRQVDTCLSYINPSIKTDVFSFKINQLLSFPRRR